MVVVKLMGGLGNQMFQYAAGRCYANNKQQDLYLDTSFLNADATNYTKRFFELGQLKVNYKIAGDNELKTFKQNSISKLLNFGEKKICYINESNFSTSQGACNNIYLEGFFQSEKYFLPIRNLLLDEIQPSIQFSPQFLEVKNQILNGNSISIHIRRGDYVSLHTASAFHGVCSIEYYLNAIKLLSDKVANPQLYVFSDDLEWCRQNLNGVTAINFVDLKEKHSSADLLLMSFCQHNIISNSSYSWWSAWLNKNPGKIVVAPKRWFLEESAYSEDIYVANWLRI